MVGASKQTWTTLAMIGIGWLASGCAPSESGAPTVTDSAGVQVITYRQAIVDDTVATLTIADQPPSTSAG